MFDDGPEVPPPGPPIWLAGIIIADLAVVLGIAASIVWLILR